MDTVLEKLVAFVLGALVVAVLVDSIDSPSEKQALYSAWMKANPASQLTYEEWNLLRYNGLLPGQIVEGNTAAESVAIGAAIGAGMASGARR